eukprot:2257764-Rhodomonas_salina.1
MEKHTTFLEESTSLRLRAVAVGGCAAHLRIPRFCDDPITSESELADFKKTNCQTVRLVPESTKPMSLELFDEGALPESIILHHPRGASGLSKRTFHGH